MSYRIDPSAPLEAEARRVSAEQIDKAIAELSAPGPDGDPHEAIHGARKRFKRLRGLARLVRPGNERFYRREDMRLRTVAKTLSAVRDRTALIESLDALAGHVPKTLAETPVRAAFAAVREGLEARRRATFSAEADLPETIAAALAALGEARGAFDALSFTKQAEKDADVLASGYAKTHARAREALKRAEKGGTAEDRHALRRHVKYLGFHLTLLAPLWPEVFAPMREAAAKIADDLGRDHDYTLLAEELETEGALAEPAHAALVRALVAARQAELQAGALEDARRLMAEKPKAAKARLRRLWRDAAAAAAEPMEFSAAAE